MPDFRCKGPTCFRTPLRIGAVDFGLLLGFRSLSVLVGSVVGEGSGSGSGAMGTT